MLKLTFVIFVVAVATTFAMDNMHRVEIGLVMGRPVHVRLFFLLLTSFLVGCFSAMLMDLYISAKLKKKRETAQDADEDDFFSEQEE